MKAYLSKNLWFKFILSIFLFSLYFSFSLASDSFDDFIHRWEYTKIINHISDSDQELSNRSLFTQMLSLKNEKCVYKERGNSYLLSPLCLLNRELPYIDENLVIENIWPEVVWFDDSYDETKTKFEYKSANPFFKNYKSIFDIDNIQKLFLIKLYDRGTYILVPKTYIMYENFKKMSFYVVSKNISLLKPCTKQNYKVALNSLDNYVLAPWNIFNLNDHISYLPWYCKWSWPQNLMFYGGVCWFASQLFRSSLLNPDMEILKRSWHSVWLTAYYSDYIYWDDAAIYQNTKQFEIKNNSKKNIYFKVMNKWDYSYFIAILSKEPEKKVNISKKQVWNLSAILEKKVYDLNYWNLLTSQTFESTYSYKSNAIR